MKTYDEFKKFFSAELLPKLTELETTRKQVIIKLIIWETIGLAATAALFLAIKALISSLSLIYLVCILPFVGLGLLKLITSQYKADFVLAVYRPTLFVRCRQWVIQENRYHQQRNGFQCNQYQYHAVIADIG